MKYFVKKYNFLNQLLDFKVSIISYRKSFSDDVSFISSAVPIATLHWIDLRR